MLADKIRREGEKERETRRGERNQLKRARDLAKIAAAAR